MKIYEYMEYAHEFTTESALPGESHFGTLAVQLPYHHTGGDFGFGTPSVKFQFSKEFDATTIDTQPLQWVAWHNGQAHQRSPIESGFQILIIYQLFREGFVSPTPLPPSPHFLMKELCKLAEGNFAEDIQPKGLVILLKHQYSWANVQGFDIDNTPMNCEKENANTTDNPLMPLLLGLSFVVKQILLLCLYQEVMLWFIKCFKASGSSQPVG